jgi:hypothetical protein
MLLHRSHDRLVKMAAPIDPRVSVRPDQSCTDLPTRTTPAYSGGTGYQRSPRKSPPAPYVCLEYLIIDMARFAPG